MAKIITRRDNELIGETELKRERMTIGRHPYNDIVLEHRGVSGEHATISSKGGAAVLEDLGSTNGTFVNGARIVRHQLADGDRIVIATFHLDYSAPPPMPAAASTIEVQNGANAGKRLVLSKPLTTLGSPGKLVVVISRQPGGDYIAKVEGEATALINGAPIAAEPRLLKDGDTLELTGTAMRYVAG